MAVDGAQKVYDEMTGERVAVGYKHQDNSDFNDRPRVGAICR